MEMEESFGAFLRRERELRFIELEEVSRATMISLRFLEAVENDDFDHLPHPTFVRGFLRAYAKYVGLNQDEVVTNYEHYIQSTTGEELLEQPEEKPRSINYARPGILVGVVVALLAGGILMYLTLSGKEQTPSISSPPEQEAASTVVAPLPEEVPAPQAVIPLTKKRAPVVVKSVHPVEDPPAVTPAKQATTPPIKKAPVEQAPVGQALPAIPPIEEQTPVGQTPVEVVPEGQAPVAIESLFPPAPVEELPPSAAITPPLEEAPVEPGPAPETAVEEKGVELTLNAREESWILFQLDDEPESEMIIQAGMSETLNAQRKIVLTVGNAGGVELVLNGEALPPLGRPGQVARGLVFEVEVEMEEGSRIERKISTD